MFPLSLKIFASSDVAATKRRLTYWILACHCAVYGLTRSGEGSSPFVAKRGIEATGIFWRSLQTVTEIICEHRGLSIGLSLRHLHAVRRGVLTDSVSSSPTDITSHNLSSRALDKALSERNHKLGGVSDVKDRISSACYACQAHTTYKEEHGLPTSAARWTTQ